MLSQALNSIMAWVGQPSAILLVDDVGFRFRNILHLVPEEGTVERWGFGPHLTTTFRYSGTREHTREQLGTIMVRTPGDRESFLSENAKHGAAILESYGEETISNLIVHNAISSFLDDVERRVRELWNTPSSADTETESVGPTQRAKDVLRQAVLDAIREREGRDEETETVPVFLVNVNRPSAGNIHPDILSSFDSVGLF